MKQVVLLFSICIMSCLDLAGQIVIDGVHPAYDRLTNTFLFSIPAHHWGKDWQARVTLEDGTDWQQVEVNGQSVDETVTFDQLEPGKTYSVRALVGDSLVRMEIELTYLPILQLRGEFGFEQAPANITLQIPGEGEQELLALAKWRGYTTNDSSKHKRNYKLNFIDNNGDKKDVRLFGLRKDNGWILQDEKPHRSKTVGRLRHKTLLCRRGVGCAYLVKRRNRGGVPQRPISGDI